ncbi:MAG TPA: TonB-dependent receptor [Aliidongia sp.]|nr:TonB-dependent receptor [Aliidongia sp.]
MHFFLGQAVSGPRQFRRSSAMRKLFLHVTAVALLACMPQIARADEAGGSVDGGASASEEILVQGQRQHSGDLKQQPNLDKTGTKLEDLPSSVEVIDRALVDQQGGVSLKDAISDASGIGQGGSDSFGFADRFLIRGLDARIYNDGFSDGDQRNGIPHSLNGVERIEILKGPGSALFGSGPPGGTINIVHFLPSDTLGYGGSVEFGSFNTLTINPYITGPTGVPGLDFRLDGLVQHTTGFRDLAGRDDEIRPELSYSVDHHFITLSVDARFIKQTPDPAGLIYLHGSPIPDVSVDTKYSTPFSTGEQTLARVNAADEWTVSPYLTINNRFSFMNRELSVLRNGDSGTIVGDALTGRQLRQQHDDINDYDYELEPLWTFQTWGIGHTLLTGFEAQRQDLHSQRATADLPNITDIFAPVIPETSAASLNFLQDAKHSGFNDDLSSTYLSFYATDQIDLTERWKLRMGIREDWWDTDLTPRVFVPGRLQPNGQLFEPGITTGRIDAPLSWNVGTLYKLTPEFSPYFGVSKSNLTVFSSESDSTGVAAPESALEYEGGFKSSAFDGRVTITAAGFDVSRKNVFTLVGDVPFFNNQETYGAEIDLDVRITPQWHLTANATGQHASLTNNPSSPTSDGKRPIGVPAAMAHLWTSYDFAVAGIEGFQVGAGVNYRDKMYGNTLNTNAIPSYVTADLAASFTHDRWTYSVGIKNLTDKTYFVAANGAGAFVGDPLTVYGRVAVNFGG